MVDNSPFYWAQENEREVKPISNHSYEIYQFKYVEHYISRFIRLDNQTNSSNGPYLLITTFCLIFMMETPKPVSQNIVTALKSPYI